MFAKINTIAAIALTVAVGLPVGASAYHDRSADHLVVGGGPFSINDCVHVQFPQCSDSDSTATRN